MWRLRPSSCFSLLCLSLQFIKPLPGLFFISLPINCVGGALLKTLTVNPLLSPWVRHSLCNLSGSPQHTTTLELGTASLHPPWSEESFHKMTPTTSPTTGLGGLQGSVWAAPPKPQRISYQDPSPRAQATWGCHFFQAVTLLPAMGFLCIFFLLPGVPLVPSLLPMHLFFIF